MLNRFKTRKIDIKNIIIFLTIFSILFIVLLSFWPSIVSVDSLVQWRQVQNVDINDAHPFYHTLLLLVLSKIWNSTTIVAIFQILCFTFIWTYICKYFRKKIDYKYNFIFHIIYVIFMCFVPLIYVYSITIWKDVLYSYVLLFMAIIFLVLEDKKYNISYKNIILISVLILLTALFRHNGLIVFILAIIYILIRMFMNKIPIKKIGVFLLSCLVLYSSTSIIKTTYLKSKNRDVEAASAIDNYMIFILSSYIHYGVQFDKKDEDIVYSIMEPKDWVDNYYPYFINIISNSPSKDNVAIKKYSNDLKKIVIKYSIKHPTLLLNHYKNADDVLWNPNPDVYKYIYSFSNDNKYGFDYIEKPILKDSNYFFSKLVSYSLNNTSISKFYTPALIMYITIIIMIIICILSRKIRYVILILPMIFNIVSLAPINLAQDLRYVYINYLTFFLALFVLLNMNLKKILIKLKCK